MMNTQTPVLTVLVLLVIGSFDMFHAQGYDPPSPPTAPGPPPPFGVAGKEFPPDGFLCNDPASTCNGKTLTCPKECPAMKPADPKAKSCSFDCNTKCEAVCKNTTANCEGVGSACGDPRFIGGDGIVFYFHGKTNQYFTLVSDPNLQINARFIGRRPQGRNKDNTWIQALGFMFGSHTFSVAANKVSKWDENVDQLTLIYNDSPVFLSEGHLSAWSAPGPVESSLRVERTAEANSVTVTLPRVAEISVSVVPITKEDDRKHNYQIPSDDCFAHLEVQFRFFQLSENVEGVLGQTYRADFQSPVKRGVAMPIMGGEDKYMTSSLLSADCRYCIFSTDSALASAIAVNTNTMECTSKFSHGRGVVCRR